MVWVSVERGFFIQSSTLWSHAGTFPGTRAALELLRELSERDTRALGEGRGFAGVDQIAASLVVRGLGRSLPTRKQEYLPLNWLL